MVRVREQKAPEAALGGGGVSLSVFDLDTTQRMEMSHL